MTVGERVILEDFICVVFTALSRHVDEYELEPIVEKLFDALHDLYVKVSARYFLLIDLPPMERSPAGKFPNRVSLPHYLSPHHFPGRALRELEGTDISDRYTTWNRYLLEQGKAFAKETPRATLSILSSHRILTEVLDTPARFGFNDPSSNPELGDESGDRRIAPEDMSGDIWGDPIHLTAEVHTIIAKHVLRALWLQES